MDTFVKESLMIPKEDENHEKLRDPLPKSKALAFVSLYEAEKKEREKSAAINADRTILQRIITAYDAGRRVDLPQLRISLCCPCYRRYQWSATIWKSVRNDGAAVSGMGWNIHGYSPKTFNNTE